MPFGCGSNPSFYKLDSYTYTGLGMRLTKSDPTGSYSYLVDGVSPASDVLTDGYSTFTPDLSEINPLHALARLGVLPLPLHFPLILL